MILTHRSYLFVPGDSARKQDKARGTGADALILDLEDSVAPDAKDAARARTADWLAEGAPMARLVRVNALSTGRTADDIAQTAPGRPDGYVLPKCEGVEDIAEAARMIAAAGLDVPLMVIASETVRAVRQLMRADWDHPALGAMTWGAEDLAADLGALANRDADGQWLPPFATAQTLALLAAKAAGVSAVDGPFTTVGDDAGLARASRAAFVMGFDGKLAIHPGQVPVIHDAFTPTAAAVDHANRVVAAMAESGVATLNGQMLDQPHLDQARKILRLAKRGEPSA
ncbi:citrate lyase subunit beta / citryl-CoA lyase [Loktanella atrilutea]|uniref:Citrate lyase subunit beta / citryl-CoA lyase n=1 Tax=Loktanella atrilutea TaxID=366533 RepID=A0A1M5DLY0_LOKAT|nr:CoA ester lyase [Loktanella atrilutea]SHF68028.1 citrate lyase subunit beta / citryl-CoA lyase [Loktanella atrilutea]